MARQRIDAIEAATKRPWTDWLAFFETIGADRLDHHAIATHLITELDSMVDNVGWWAQATAVAYEHHIGRRVPGQQPDGTFRTTVSRATPLRMEELMRAWTAYANTDPDVGDMITTQPRISGTQNRITWRTKGTEKSTITIISEPKKNGTASLIIQHGGLPSPEASATAKQRWLTVTERFLSRQALDRGR